MILQETYYPASNATLPGTALKADQMHIDLLYVFAQNTFMDANKALWQVRRNSTKSRLLGWLLLACLPLALWLAVYHGMFFILLAVVIANAMHWIFDWPLTRTIIMRKFKQAPLAGKPITWKINATTLKVKAAGKTSKILWKDIIQAYETEKGFVLAQSGGITHWLPIAAFSTKRDADQMRHWISTMRMRER